MVARASTKRVLPRIEAVEAFELPLTLHVRWRQGGSYTIDVSGLVQALKLYAPLRDDHDLFRSVRVGEHGADVVGSDDIDMSNDTLWQLAQEQSGATMTSAS